MRKELCNIRNYVIFILINKKGGAFCRDALDFDNKTNPIPLPHLKTVLPREKTNKTS